MGLALPAGFDEQLRAGEVAAIDAYVWGESLLRDRAVLGATVAVLVRQIAGQPTPVEIQITTVGDAVPIPWEQRLIPLLVLMGMVLAGLFVPATSLVGEKTWHTLGALAVTPATLGEILGSKAFVGVVLSMTMTAAVLAINGILSGEAWLLLLVLALGSVAAGVFGLLLGVIAKDINSLMAVVKGIGILLYAPALVALFPSIPEWVARVFPTYYLLHPVLEVSQNSAGLAEVAPELGVLLLLIAALIAATGFAARRMRLAEA
jgi:ABC-2 type transport system permease protein